MSSRFETGQKKETGISLEQLIFFKKINIIISIAEFRLLLYTRIFSRITFIVYTDDLLAKIMLILMGLKAWIQFHKLNLQLSHLVVGGSTDCTNIKENIDTNFGIPPVIRSARIEINQSEEVLKIF